MKRALFSVEGNRQKLDGGAMFGNCPKPVWEKWIAADERNRIDLACRGLLVREPSGRTILCETGIGAFFPPKLRERFGVAENEHVLLKSLAALDVKPTDIDVVVLSHLHFDHAGGLLTAWAEAAPYELVFPNASYVVSDAAWARAKHPHMRDRASFIPELVPLLEATGRVEVLPVGDGSGPCTVTSRTLGDGFSFFVSNGHTPGLMLTTVEGPDGPITFLGDLVPGMAWVHVPITMGYDRFPEVLIDEKRVLLDQVVARSGWVFYTHDPKYAASRVTRTESGAFAAADAIETLRWS
jgi:glyoxylase-like metal-dependent hydrolase (beta-lactamase superfamily II)